MRVCLICVGKERERQKERRSRSRGRKGKRLPDDKIKDFIIIIINGIKSCGNFSTGYPRGVPDECCCCCCCCPTPCFVLIIQNRMRDFLICPFFN